MPRLRRQIDVYESNELANESSQTSYAIVTWRNDVIVDKSFLARLYISRLGVTSEVQRLLSSKHRVLFIGPLESTSHRYGLDIKQTLSYDLGTDGTLGWVGKMVWAIK